MNACCRAHVHTWQFRAHVDGCHRYEWWYACECGAGRRVWGERDIASDPHSSVWMADEGGEPCDRCDALMAGAKPQNGDEIAEPEASGPKAEGA